mmetsp:Transcript_1228/g.1238  ORF Transcript_1228/g.1238 Transcript_1228/m.1238 type:complete len:224 (+) Transcript_1228:193-864(+)
MLCSKLLQSQNFLLDVDNADDPEEDPIISNTFLNAAFGICRTRLCDCDLPGEAQQLDDLGVLREEPFVAVISQLDRHVGLQVLLDPDVVLHRPDLSHNGEDAVELSLGFLVELVVFDGLWVCSLVDRDCLPFRRVRKSLVQLLRDVRHHWVEQPKRIVDHSEHCVESSQLLDLVCSLQRNFARLEVPVAEVFLEEVIEVVCERSVQVLAQVLVRRLDQLLQLV